MRPNPTKAKAPALARGGFAGKSVSSALTDIRHSTRSEAGRKAAKPHRCPVCNRAAASKSVALAHSGETMHTKLCESCGGAVAMSTEFGRAAFHRIAQHQHYREVCHAA